MNTEKMTVHRALAELKTIDSRIDKAIKGTSFCFANRRRNTKVNGVELKDAVDQMKGGYKSVRTLINRRNAMKRAVTQSNTVTEVEIGGTKYRVAEAIEMKNHGMDNYRLLRTAVAGEYTAAKAQIDKLNGEFLEDRADEYVRGLFGSKEKVDGSEAEITRKAYIDTNTYDLIDPLDVLSIMKELDDLIETFNAEVDSALSVSNAITEIEFSYEVE